MPNVVALHSNNKGEGMHGEGKDYEKRVPSSEAERMMVACAKLALIDAQSEFLTLFGVNSANVESVEEFKKDLMFVRSFRKREGIWRDIEFLSSARAGTVKAACVVFVTMLTILTTAFVYEIWKAFRASITGVN